MTNSQAEIGAILCFGIERRGGWNFHLCTLLAVIRKQTTLKPQQETFTKDRVSWYKGTEALRAWSSLKLIIDGGDTERSEV